MSGVTWVRLLPNGSPWPTGIPGFELRPSCANCAHINTHREFEEWSKDMYSGVDTPPRPFCGLGSPAAPPDGTRGDEALNWFRAMQEHAKTRRVAPNGWCPQYVSEIRASIAPTGKGDSNE